MRKDILNENKKNKQTIKLSTPDTEIMNPYFKQLGLHFVDF